MFDNFSGRESYLAIKRPKFRKDNHVIIQGGYNNGKRVKVISVEQAGTHISYQVKVRGVDGTLRYSEHELTRAPKV